MTLTAADTAIRSGRITASKVACILGEGLWGSEFTAWTEIMGLPTEDISELDHVLAGNFFEDGVCRFWQHRVGNALGLRADPEAPQTVVHPRHSWLCATPDRFVRDARGEIVAILEAKTGGWYREDEWCDRDTGEITIPVAYALQVQTQLEVLDMEHAHVAAVIGGNRPFFAEITRDRELMGNVLALLEAWYVKHVLGNVAPEPTGRKCDTSAIRRMLGRESGETVRLSAAAVEFARRSEELKAQISKLDEEREALRNKVRMDMGSASFAEGAGVRVANKTDRRGVQALHIDAAGITEKRKKHG